MRLIVKQTESAGKMFWIVRDTDPSWRYYGPFADEAAAHAFARTKNKSEAWKEMLRMARANGRAAAAALAA